MPYIKNLEIEAKTTDQNGFLIGAKFIIEQGKIQNIIFSNDFNYIYSKSKRPEKRASFKLIKLPSSKSLTLKDFSHELVFTSNLGNKTTFYCNLNLISVVRIRWQKNSYWVQKTDNWMKFIVPIITAILGFLLNKWVFC